MPPVQAVKSPALALIGELDEGRVIKRIEPQLGVSLPKSA
jgi:hypothetical protein